MTMRSPGWAAGMVGLDARPTGIAVRPGLVAARREGVIPGLDTTGVKLRGVAFFAVAFFAVAFFAVAFFAVAFFAVAFFAVAFFAVAFFADTVGLPALTEPCLAR